LSLVDFAKTDRQRQTIIAWEECGRNSGMVAAKLGIACSTVRDHIAYVKNTAAAAGYSDNWDARRHVPEGEVVIGRSVFTTRFR
jgi:hypothetical protein